MKSVRNNISMPKTIRIELINYIRKLTIFSQNIDKLVENKLNLINKRLHKYGNITQN